MEHIKISKHTVLIVLAAVATVIFYFWFVKQPFFGAFVAWSGRWLWLYVIVLVFFKALAIVWPPIPGGLLTLCSGAGWFVGWFDCVLLGAQVWILALVQIFRRDDN